MLPIRVVLADDHPSLRAGLRARLEKERDIEVAGEAGTGEEAFRLATELKPHVLLLDMQMPGISGIEVARRLKAAEAPVRILALSAHDNEEYVVKLLDSGASGYLTKQEPLETIVSAVRGVAKGEEGWMSRDASKTLIRHQLSRRTASADPARILTRREREVMMHLARGKSNQQIADELFITESTVKKHVNSIYFKLEVNSRAEAVAWAWEQGIVEADE